MFRQSVPLHDLLGTYGLHEEGGLGMVAEAAIVKGEPDAEFPDVGPDALTPVDAIKHTPS